MAGLKDRLIQYVLRGKDELSPAAKASQKALAGLAAQAAQLGTALDDAKSSAALAKSLERTARDVDVAKRNLASAQTQVIALQDALAKDPGSKGLSQSLSRAERAAQTASRQLNALQVDLDRSERSAREAGINTSNLGAEHTRLAREVDKAKQALAQNTQQTQEAQRAQASAARATAEHSSRLASVRQGMTAGAQQVIAFAAAFVGLNAVLGLVGRGFDAVKSGIGQMLSTGDQFELLGKRMASLMGSVEGGEQATEWIKQFARNTPLQVAEVSEAFALLKSYGLDPMDGTLAALVDKNEQLGGGYERLAGITTAVGQAFAKQKLQTEEILQLIERGVPVWGMLEKITGKNAAALQDMASKGQLGRDVISQLVAEIGNSAKGAAADNMGTLTGLVSNLGDSWADFLNRIATSGALDYAKKQLSALADTIAQMDSDGRMDKLAKALATAFEQGGEKVKEFAARLVEVDFNQLIDSSSAWLSDFGAKMESAAQSVQMFAAPFRTLFNGITSGLSVAGLAVVKFGELHLAVFSKIAAAMPDALGGRKLREGIAEAGDLLTGLSETFTAQIAQDSQDIANAWDVTTQAATDSAKAQTEAARAASAEQIKFGQVAADWFIEGQNRSKQAADAAAAAGTRAFTDMNDALATIGAAQTVQQLDGLREALLSAYQAGTISQQEYAAASVELNNKLGAIGTTAKAVAGEFETAVAAAEKFSDLSKLIGSADNDRELDKLRARIRELYEGGKLSANEYAKALDATTARHYELGKAASKAAKDVDELASAQEASAKAAEQEKAAAEQRRQALGNFFGGTISAAREAAAALSSATEALFARMRGLEQLKPSIDTSGLEQTRASAQRLADQLGDVQRVLNSPLTSSLGKWAAETKRAGIEAQLSYLGQKQAMQELMRSYEEGRITTAAFAKAAESASKGLGLLDSSDLSSLRSAAESAKKQMEGLRDSTRSTLDTLRDELDALEGRQASIDERKYQNRLRALQTQLAEAQASGDSSAISNASRAISTLRQVQSATEAKAARELVEKRNKEADESAKAKAPQASQQPPQKVIQLQIPGAQSVDVALKSDADETKLLDILAKAGLRSM